MSNIELVGIALGIIGVIVSIYYGVKSKSGQQSQKVGAKAIGIQSGGDTKIDNVSINE